MSYSRCLSSLSVSSWPLTIVSFTQLPEGFFWNSSWDHVIYLFQFFSSYIMLSVSVTWLCLQSGSSPILLRLGSKSHVLLKIDSTRVSSGLTSPNIFQIWLKHGYCSLSTLRLLGPRRMKSPSYQSGTSFLSSEQDLNCHRSSKILFILTHSFTEIFMLLLLNFRPWTVLLHCPLPLPVLVS